MMVSVNQPAVCKKQCGCKAFHPEPKLVVLTGGPGAGKTAVLEIIRKELCEHVVILPEAASIVFGGGFWRLDTLSGHMAAQRAILHIQQSLERLVIDEGKWPLVLCDRGTLDALAYWPGEETEFWQEAGTSLEAEYKRYHSVIHLRVPTDELGYNHNNPLRIESSVQAAAIDEKIHKIWARHPKYHMVNSSHDFLTKVESALHYIREDVPACCLQQLDIDSCKS